MSAYCLGAWRWCILISSSTFFWTSFLTTIFLKYTLLGAGKFFTFHPCLVSSARVTPSEFRQNFWWEYHNAWTNRLYKIDNNFHSTLPCPHSSSEMPLEQSWSCWYIHAPDVCWTSPSSTPPILQQQITNTKRYISHWIPTPSNSPMIFQSSSSRMSVMNRNWLAAKQRLHPQSVAEISCHSVFSGDRIRQCWTLSGSGHKDTDQCLCHHLLLQAPQCSCWVRKRLCRDHCWRGRLKPGLRIVGSHARWELTICTVAH